MACGTSDPLPKPVKAKTAEKDENGTADAAPVHDKAETSEVATVQHDSAVAVSTTAISQTTGDPQHTEEGTSRLSQSLPEVAQDVTIDDTVDAAAETEELDPDIIHLVDVDDPVTPGNHTDEKERGATTNAGSKEDGAEATPMDVDELENMESDDEEEPPLLFRCISCKRCAHYEHCKFFSFELTGRVLMTALCSTETAEAPI